jgi:hypothetical protein
LASILQCEEEICHIAGIVAGILAACARVEEQFLIFQSDAQCPETLWPEALWPEALWPEAHYLCRSQDLILLQLSWLDF